MKKLVDVVILLLAVGSAFLLYDRFFGGEAADGGRPDTAAIVATLVGADLSGVSLAPSDSLAKGVTLGAGEPAFLAFFSHTCPACLASRDAWSIVAEQSGVLVYAVPQTSSLPSEAEGFVEERTLVPAMPQMPTGQADKTAGLYLPVVPITVLVSGEGVIQEAWVGRVSPARADSMLHAAR